MIIEAWEPGAKGGEALADIIMGQINPSGKLPITIPYSVGHLQAIYDHKPSAYRHKFVDTPTKNLFEFGFGLSYSTYEYEAPKLSKKQIKSRPLISFSLKSKKIIFEPPLSVDFFRLCAARAVCAMHR